jgi:hypothetical protein
VDLGGYLFFERLGFFHGSVLIRLPVFFPTSKHCFGVEVSKCPCFVF